MLRPGAVVGAARYAPMRGYDENSAFVALYATLFASLVLIIGAVALRG